MTSLKFVAAAAMLVIAVGCATTPVQNKENLLASAGFKTITPSTESQKQIFRTLQPGKVSTVKKNGKTYYVYPDTAHNVAYVGTAQQYQAYKKLKQQQHLNNEELEVQNTALEKSNGMGSWMGWSAVGVGSH